MDVFKIYFQRLSYNGQDYTKGRFLDPQQEMGLYCRSITISPMQDMKDIVTLDWPGEDGVDGQCCATNEVIRPEYFLCLGR